jgi:hypothetical protein
MAARKRITEIAEELQSWLPNYDHGPNDLPTIIWRTLASMPGGDEAADMGYEPLIANFGWREVELLGDMLDAIEDPKDVEDLVALLADDGEEEEDDS